MLICDGAAPDLTFLKPLMEKRMHGVCKGVDLFEVKLVSPTHAIHSTTYTGSPVQVMCQGSESSAISCTHELAHTNLRISQLPLDVHSPITSVETQNTKFINFSHPMLRNQVYIFL